MKIDLSSAEKKLFVKLAGDALDVTSTDEFKVWTQTSVRKLFPHEMLIAGVAQRNGTRVDVDGLLFAGFPLAFLDAVTARHGTFVCPTLVNWFKQGRPQLFEPNKRLDSAQISELSTEFDSFNLKNVAAHGVVDISGGNAIYFSFSQIPEKLNARHANMLELLVPHLHHAYVRATISPVSLDQLPSAAAKRRSLGWSHGLGLSARELQILYWLCAGKSNDEIAHILNRARNTIKHQVSDIFAKLNVRNRNEAVTFAVRVGILPDRRVQPHAAINPANTNRPTRAIK